MLTVLAYGRWCEHVEHAWQAEQEAVQQFIEEGRTQGETRTVGGRDLREVKSAAHGVQAFLENALPVDTPKELGAVMSDSLLDAVDAVVADRRRQLPELRLDVIRPIVASLAVRYASLARLHLPLIAQKHPKLNYLLWTAAGSGADYLVTNNTALLASNGEPYPIAALTLPGGEAPQTTTYSVSLDTFIDHELSKYPFDLEKVDGELLITATTGELSHGAASN
jgi:hypothetical protein